MCNNSIRGSWIFGFAWTIGVFAILAARISAAEMTVTTLAGPEETPGAFDGPGIMARFNTPFSIATDAEGNSYVADSYNHVIRKMTPDGEVTTLAGLAGVYGSADGRGGSARFYLPMGVAVDSAGNVYVADMGNSTIRKITPDGLVVTWAGAALSAGSTDGIGSAARFYGPYGVTVDGGDNLYVADSWNGTIRKITPEDTVSTLAGTPGGYGSDDGIGPAAKFKFPVDVSVDSAGNIYVADSYNHNIRKVAPDRAVTTIAGTAGSGGYSNGPGAQAKFLSPTGVQAGNDGAVYVADSGNHVIRLISSGGMVSTFAGTTSGDADGSLATAQFNYPNDIAGDLSGNLYVLDSGNHKVRRITSGGVVASLAGQALRTGTNDGPVASAHFNDPYGIAVDNAGRVHLADTFNYTLRAISPDGVVTTLAGLAGSYGDVDGTGTVARFNGSGGIAFDPAGNMYIADTWNNHVRKMTAGRVVTTYAGTNPPPGGGTEFYSPAGLAVDNATNIYVADTFHHKIQKVTANMAVSVLAGSGVVGSQDGTGTVAQFNYPTAVAVDSAGTVYVADTYNSTIRKITPAGLVSTLAGSALSTGSVDGVGSAARFNNPKGIAVDSAFNVYLADTVNCTVRMITPDGTVSTIAGLDGSSGVSNGVGGAARFTRPTGIALDGSGNLYVTDVYSVRKLYPALVASGTIDQAVARVDDLRQLGASGSGAAYEWRQVRKSSASEAVLSSTNTAQPTFTPDVADYYLFRLLISSGLAKSISYVSLLATPWPTPLTGDIDGDRLADLIEVVGSSWYVWFSSAQYQVRSGPFNMGQSGTPVTGDIDGDGLADLMVVAGSKWYVWFSTAGYQVCSGPFDMNISGTPLTGDIDGDRLADLITVIGSDWYVWFSTAQYQVRCGPYDLGVSGTPLTGDIDGDRLADLISVVGSNWYVWFSTAGYQIRSGPFDLGLSGAPVTGDIDGDRLADLISVVGCNWYVWFSTAQYQVRCGPYALSAP